MFLNYLPSVEKLKRHQKAVEEKGVVRKISGLLIAVI